MEPRVTKRDRRLQLSYELPHRIHCAQIYPVTAPNGSTVIIYGHDSGLRVLWRGGKRRKLSKPASTHPPQLPNGVSSDTDVIILDSDADESAQGTKSKQSIENQYEDEEDELDPDSPYPPIIEDLEISVGTDVLHVAVPSVNPTVLALAPEILSSTALISISSADGALRVIQLPLEPPAPDEKDAAVTEISRSQIELFSSGPVAADLKIKLVNFAQQNPSAGIRSQGADGALLVAAAALQSLKVWQIQIADGELVEPEKNQFRSQPLPAQASKLAFHPSARSAQLLLADISGAVRIYDPFTSTSPSRRPTSSDSMFSFNANPSSSSSSSSSTSGSSGWKMTYHTSFLNPKDSNATSPPSPILARRKRILDADWILSGKAILTLLEDGEWGIWDVLTSTPSTSGTSSKPPSSPSTFLSHGFLSSTSDTTTTTSSSSSKPAAVSTSSRLAPMTPNTRAAKSASLFSALPPPKPLSAHAGHAGGLSVARTSPKAGRVDESVAIWFAGEIYGIASVQAFWQRVLTEKEGKGGGKGFGSLYAPGLAKVPGGVEVGNEGVTSVSQFGNGGSQVMTGGQQMGGLRDLVISAERRLVVLQGLRPGTPSRGLFQQQLAQHQSLPVQQQQQQISGAERFGDKDDQLMLDAGELDIGGMDRILDSMAAASGAGGEGRTRKVGFAH